MAVVATVGYGVALLLYGKVPFSLFSFIIICEVGALVGIFGALFCEAINKRQGERKEK